jgi:hypothetical protein
MKLVIQVRGELDEEQLPHSLKLWKWVNWLDMLMMFGIHSQLQRVILGGICPIMQWYLTIPELQWKRKRDTQTELGIASHVFSKIAPLEQQYLIVDDGKVVSNSYRYAFKT